MVLSPFKTLPVAETSFSEYILQILKSHEGNPCLVDGITGETWSFSDVRVNMMKITSYLCKHGVSKGDVVAIFSHNSPHWVMFFLGVLATGATVTTINPAYTASEVARHLKDSRARYLYGSSITIPIVKAATSTDPSTKIQILFSPDEVAGCVPFSELLSDDGLAFPASCPSRGDDVATLLYSSGTTGLPKGVMTTHKNLLASSMQLRHPDLVNPDLSINGEQTTCLLMLPLYHVYGMVGILTWSLIGGYRTVTLPKFEPEIFLKTVQEYKVNVAPLVPPLVVFLAKSPLVDRYDLSSLKEIHSGAAPLSKEVELELKGRIGVKFLRQSYGMTELTSAVNFVPYKMQDKYGSIGPPIPGNEIIVIDVITKKSLGPNEPGEVWVRGDQVMKGYLNKPEATRETVDQNGFLHTGDIGYYDKDGYFYIVDRLKELIKYKALQVAPAELEAVVLTHPSVADCAVTGVPDERYGELPKALVVLKEGMSCSQEQIMSYVAERVADYKRLRGGVEFVDRIPKTPSGKILRKELNAKYRLNSKL